MGLLPARRSTRIPAAASSWRRPCTSCRSSRRGPSGSSPRASGGGPSLLLPVTVVGPPRRLRDARRRGGGGRAVDLAPDPRVPPARGREAARLLLGSSPGDLGPVALHHAGTFTLLLWLLHRRARGTADPGPPLGTVLAGLVSAALAGSSRLRSARRRPRRRRIFSAPGTSSASRARSWSCPRPPAGSSRSPRPPPRPRPARGRPDAARPPRGARGVERRLRVFTVRVSPRGPLMFRTRARRRSLLALLGLLVALGRERQRERRSAAAPTAPEEGSNAASPATSRPEDPGGAHARAAVGCSSCHLGNPLAFDKERAHAGMEPEPGALPTVALHLRPRRLPRPRGAARRHVAHGAASGIVSVDRFAFGEIPSRDGTATMADVLAPRTRHRAESPPEALRRLPPPRAGKPRRRDPRQRKRLLVLPRRAQARRQAAPAPAVDARVTDDRCLGCHSRSGRIALTYEGLYEVRKGAPFAHAAPDVHRPRASPASTATSTRT